MTDNLPTKWDEELAKFARAQAALERPAVGRIGFKAGIMTYQGTPIPGNKLNVVIVASAKEHALYQNILDQRPFDPLKPEAPICYALSLSGENMVPHPQAVKPQAPSCAECPWNAWASDPKGGKGKACKESRRLLVLPSNAAAGPIENVKKSEAAGCSVPVTSVKNWANYTAQLSGEYGRPTWAMVTEISVHPHARTVFEVKFAATARVDDQYLSELMQRSKASEAQVMTPYAEASAAAPPAQPQANRRY